MENSEPKAIEKFEEANLSVVICRYLRGKTAYGTNEGGETPWLLLEDAGTTVFRCVRTGEAVGPDDYFADSNLCRAGRRCFSSQG